MFGQIYFIKIFYYFFFMIFFYNFFFINRNQLIVIESISFKLIVIDKSTIRTHSTTYNPVNLGFAIVTKMKLAPFDSIVFIE